MRRQRVKEGFKEKQCPFILICHFGDSCDLPLLGASEEGTCGSVDYSLPTRTHPFGDQ